MDDKETLNRRYRLGAWGALLVWVGAASFLPGERLSLGLGLLGIGAILLAVNLARRVLHGLAASPTDVILGAIAVALGVAALFRSLLVVPVGMIALGLALLVRCALPPRQESTTPDCCCAGR